MYNLTFNTVFGERLFNISTTNYPLPHVGDKVKFERDHYVVDDVIHCFGYIEGIESTGIRIVLSLDPDMVFPTTNQRLLQGHCIGTP